MKVYITLSKDGISNMALTHTEFCTCRTPKGLKSNITKKYEKIYNNCRNFFGNGTCVASFTSDKGIELGKLNINVR